MESLRVVVRVPPASARAARDRHLVAAKDAGSSSYSSGDTSDELDAARSPTPLHAPVHTVGTKRKSSYTMQKDEIAKLRSEAETLESEIQRLDTKRPAALALAHLQLQCLVRANRLAIAGAQSLVDSLKDDAPVGTYIHLPHDAVDRQRILKAIKPHQLDDAAAYMLARCQYADLTRETRQTEVSTTAAGDHVAQLWEIAHVTEGAPTVQRVFDEMVAFSCVREMALADRVGLLDIRESDLDVDPSDAAQSRILSTHASGLLVEKNGVAHSQCFGKSTLSDQPYAVYVIDSVDRDDAFPYNPLERIRQDGVSVWLVLETPSVSASASPQRSIAIIKYAYVRARKNTLATADQLAAIAEDGLRACSSVMLNFVRERLALEAATSWREQP